jgi:hypothetical protein
MMKKSILTRLKGDERGQALLLALVFMLLGTLIVTPLLSHMSTGLKTGKQVYEKRMAELYAADAGVEDAIWQLKFGGLTVPSGGTVDLPQSTVNGKTVNVAVKDMGQLVYKITSVASSSGSNTTLEVYIKDFDFAGVLDNAVTSRNTITLKPGTIITGQFSLPDPSDTFRISGGAEADNGVITVTTGGISVTVAGGATYNAGTGAWTTPAGGGTVTIAATENSTQGSWTYQRVTTTFAITVDADGDAAFGGGASQYYQGAWPTADQFIDIYLGQVDTSQPYPSGTIDVKDTSSIGPLYRNGDLEIKNSDNNEHTVTLNGTVYVTGKLTTTQKAFTLNLNGQTIFVQNASTSAIDITGGNNGCRITGSGCIIAVGDIYFSPRGSSNPDDYVFVMSIDGKVRFQPQGDFYGSIAGDAEVYLAPGGTFSWTGWSDEGLNFPVGPVRHFEIRNWKVTP